MLQIFDRSNSLIGKLKMSVNKARPCFLVVFMLIAPMIVTRAGVYLKTQKE